MWAANALGAAVCRVAPGGQIVDEVGMPDGLGVFACGLGGDRTDRREIVLVEGVNKRGVVVVRRGEPRRSRIGGGSREGTDAYFGYKGPAVQRTAANDVGDMDDFITPPARPSYASGVPDVPLLGDTIGDNFDRTVAAEPQREALVEVATGRRWTYQQLRAEVDALALGLIDAGVDKGDRVGIWAPNMAE